MRVPLTLAAAVLLVPTAAVSAPAAAPSLLPAPVSLTPGTGHFDPARAALAADPADRGASAALARFQDLLARSGGPRLRRASGGTGAIRFVRDPAVAGAEAYRLVVTPSGAIVSASGDAGLYYGAETLWQLAASAKDGRIPALRIEDKPAFAWRGLMLDSVRHFQPVSYIEQLLDRMALAKLNVFHWHLTDDQGWRLEIDRYPKLTEVGAWRTPAGAEGRDPKTGEPVRYGGFYTKADVARIVAYAAARHIAIVPEIEMPGHATAMIAAYPELASTANPPTAPSSDWGILPNLLNTSDKSFAFVENVLDEVMTMFPGKYIHVGGDEAPKGQWATDEHVRATLTQLGLPEENALQGWFTARIGRYLEAHGRRLIGWDEILAGGIPANAAIMSWHGIDGAIAAAKAGHDAVLAPAPVLYLDNRQSDSADEPPGRGEIIDWKRLYAFDPAPPTLTADERGHILGLQANLWTEHVRTAAYADRMIWPRAAIAAELGWSPASARDWSGFSARLVAATDRWRKLGWSYDLTPLEPEAKLEGETVKLVQPAGIGTLRYTLDGRRPTPASPAYADPIPLARAGRVAAQAFLDGEPLGAPRSWSFTPADLRTRAAADMRLCSAKLPIRLEDDGATQGIRKVHWVDAMRPCWVWPQAPLDGATTISAEVGSVPYNFALGDAIAQVTFRKPATPAGEMEVRQDRCDGPLIATLPLAPAAANSGDTKLTGRIGHPVSGAHDLCITFTQNGPDPMWLLDRLTLGPARP